MNPREPDCCPGLPEVRGREFVPFLYGEIYRLRFSERHAGYG